MSPHQDASASLTLALQKIGRAKYALEHRNSGTAKMELDYAVNAIEDAQSVLRDEPGHVVTCDPAFHGGTEC